MIIQYKSQMAQTVYTIYNEGKKAKEFKQGGDPSI